MSKEDPRVETAEEARIRTMAPPSGAEAYARWLEHMQRTRTRHAAITRNCTPGRTTRTGPTRCATTGWPRTRRPDRPIRFRPGAPTAPRLAPGCCGWKAPPTSRASAASRPGPRQHRTAFISCRPRPRLGGAHVVLRVTQRGHDRDAQRTQKSHQRLVGHGIAAHAVGDDAQAMVVAMHLRHQQQILYAARAGMDVDIRGQHRHQDLVGGAGQLRHLLCLDRRRRVDDHAAGAFRDAQLKAAGDARVALESLDEVDARLGLVALGSPAGR